MSNVGYRRGQAEWALWRAFTLYRGHSHAPPEVFKTRIKRLLDLDRTPGASGAAHAFTALAGGGTGSETLFAPFDVFCLGLALDLLDIGFKQSEVVLVMRHVREDLAEWFARLLARPSLIDRQNHLALLHPDLPAIERPGRAALADARVLLLLNRVELTEVLALDTHSGEPVVLAPEICVGVGGLEARVHALMPLHRRSLIVVEIAALAQAVVAFLEQAPIIARGRPKKA